MPELPEVEVIRAGLAHAVTGARVTRVTVLDERSLRRHPGPSEDFVERLTGATVLAPARRGKFLWLPLAPKTKEIWPPDAVFASNTPDSAASPSFSAASEPLSEPPRPISAAPGSLAASPGSSPAAPGSLPATPGEALVVHLGMSGQVLLREPGREDPLTRIRIDLAHPDHGRLRLNFVDQRIFGSMAIDELLPAADVPGQLVPSRVAHIARDPIDPLFDDALFLRRLAARKTGIKRAMLDQTLISGVGNIYADEALWAARIHYNQPTNLLSRVRAKTLLAEIRLVLGKALVEGGTSFDAQYLNVNGESGYFSHSLQVYGQQGKPCPRCGRPIIRESFMNRGSHFCAFCQRLR